MRKNIVLLRFRILHGVLYFQLRIEQLCQQIVVHEQERKGYQQKFIDSKKNGDHIQYCNKIEIGFTRTQTRVCKYLQDIDPAQQPYNRQPEPCRLCQQAIDIIEGNKNSGSNYKILRTLPAGSRPGSR